MKVPQVKEVSMVALQQQLRQLQKENANERKSKAAAAASGEVKNVLC